MNFFTYSEESLFELGENQIETAMEKTIEAASVCPEGTNEVLEKENMSNTFGVKLRKKSRFGQELERSGSRRSGIQNDTGKIQFHFFMKIFNDHKMNFNWPKIALTLTRSNLTPKMSVFDLKMTPNDTKMTNLPYKNDHRRPKTAPKRQFCIMGK